MTETILHQSTPIPPLSSSTPTLETETETTESKSITQKRNNLKQKLLTLSASYDRGYGATPSSRSSVQSIIDSLAPLNPTPDARMGVMDKEGDKLSEENDNMEVPLEGIWQMVWTTAQDVLLLNASPFFTIGAIYQIATNLPTIVNVIDLIPRGQALLPPDTLNSLLRLEVTTRANTLGRKENRIGLVFEKVMAQPRQLLGMDNMETVLPPLSLTLPSFQSTLVENVIETLNLNEDGDTPGYFDVLYLDMDMLIIQQNAPGGLFVLVKSDSSDP